MKVWNIKNLLEWTTGFFESKGIQHPRLSAELLLGSVMKLSRMQLYLNYDYVLSPEELSKYKELIVKRAQHVPVQYILNKTHFRNLELYVDENVMIPRPETELVVESALSKIVEILSLKVLNLEKNPRNNLGDKARIKNETWDLTSGKVRNQSAIDNSNRDNVVNSAIGKRVDINVLEVGVGSGAISISIAQEIDERLAKELFEKTQVMLDEIGKVIQMSEISWNIIGTENSSSALEIARKNASSILEEGRLRKVEFIRGDIIPDSSNFLEKYRKKINLLVSNPPYISEKDYANLPREVKDYEPKSALVGGETGVEIYEKIIVRARSLLAEDVSYIIFEIDPKVKSAVLKLLSALNPKSIDVYRDYNGLDRIVVARIN